MTEAEWLGCTDPHKMLDFLRDNASVRKLWLFVAVCARAIRPFFQGLSNDQEDTADLWESYADGQATELDVKRAFRARMNLSLEPPLSPPWQAARSGVFEVMFWFTPRGATEYPLLCEMIRDVFGNPYRPVSIAPAWLTPTVTSLAAVAYEERSLPSGELDPTRLAILADALEESGCDNAETLNHLRNPGPHVRGCWVLDLILGKE